MLLQFDSYAIYESVIYVYSFPLSHTNQLLDVHSWHYVLL